MERVSLSNGNETYEYEYIDDSISLVVSNNGEIPRPRTYLARFCRLQNPDEVQR